MYSSLNSSHVSRGGTSDSVKSSYLAGATNCGDMKGVNRSLYRLKEQSKDRRREVRDIYKESSSTFCILF